MYFTIDSLYRVRFYPLSAISTTLNAFRFSSTLRGRSDVVSKSCVVGLSAGTLAAAAVALSPATPALIPLAVEVVLIAFRIGLYVKSTAAYVEIPIEHDSSASWSYAVPGTTEDQAKTALALFHDEKVMFLVSLLKKVALTYLTDYPTFQLCLRQRFYVRIRDHQRATSNVEAIL